MPLIIPSEVQTREFDAKLLLACIATEKGFHSIIGGRTDIHLNIASLPRSVYLAKDVRSSSRKMFGILRRLGHSIVALDEEALMHYSRESYIRARVSAPVLRQTQALFAWGTENAEAWRQCPYYHGAPIHVTGNPRLDLMRPELRSFFDAEVAELRQRFGRFILVNTNFGILNHFFPNLSTLLPPSPAEQSAAKADDLAAHRHRIFRSFVEMLPRLARAFPEQIVVLRPHPAENHDTWRKAGAGCDNLRVVHEGNVIPWLLAADAVVHNSCTTGFEAYLVGTPTIAFVPFMSELYDLALPNEVSHQASNIDMLIDMVRAAKRGELNADCAERERRRGLAEHHAAALDGPLAADRIVAVLDAFERSNPSNKPNILSYTTGRLLALIRRKSKERNATIPGHKDHPDYARHRFPGIELQEVERRIERLRNALGRFPRARAVQRGKNIFEIAA